MLLPLLLVGCQPEDPKESASEDTGYAWHDTSPVVETGDDTAVDTSPVDDTAETGGETADTAPVDTGGPTWLTLDVYPGAIVVDVGATFTLRVVATDPDGTRGDLPRGGDTATFTVDDPAIATVDGAGIVTAVAEGTTTVRVDIGGLEATAAIDVRADSIATITVLDGVSGLPIAGARVALPDTPAVTTDATGVALLPVADPGPLTFSTWVDDTYDALTVTGVVGRQLTVSISPKDTVVRDATLSGAIDYSGVDDAGWSDVVVGFAAASIQGALASVRLEDLFSEDRSVTVFGVAVDAPSNIFVEGAADDYVATAIPGPVAVWGLGGPIAITDATAGFSGTGDALRLLADNLDKMSWGQVTGLTAVSGGDTVADLAPADRFDDTLPLTLPSLSLGFHGDEDLFVLVSEERADEGFVVTGLGAGSGALDVPMVPAGTVADSLGTSVLAYGQVGGVGSGGATSTAVGTVGTDGTVSFAPLEDIATVDTYDAATRGLGVTVDADADLVRIRLTDDRHRIHDVLAPASWSGTLPMCVTGFHLAHATVEVLAIQTADGAYEGWLAAGDLDPDTKTSVAAARTTQEN
jgi:hypothetical protein